MLGSPLAQHKRFIRRAVLAAVTLGLFFCFAPTALGQISAGGVPASFALSAASIPPTVTMSPVDVEAFLTEDAQAPKDSPLRFGAPIDVLYTLSNSGSWEILPDGSRIWRLRIASPGAYSLGLLYHQWFLPEGATLFLYNDDRSQVIGAFTSFNNWMDGTNTTQPVAGDACTIEYYEPATAYGQGVLTISRVVHAYRNIFGFGGHNPLDDYGDSGTCNNNVNCPEGQPWQADKCGVAMILDGGFRLCTGVLVNNTNNDFTPYFLTANHCLGGEQSWTFMFNYESPGCPNQDGPTNQTVSNATRRANNAASDFALLQISANIPLNYNPYFCGWNRADEAWNNSVCIHHPNGDIKKITFDDDAPISDTWNGTPANSHWRIANWDDGTTEPGSSGSPLYDENHRITGQLHGGQATCTNNVNDYYGKFSLSWNYGGSASTRLRDWLDPAQTDPNFLDGIDPNQTGRVAGTVQDMSNQPLEDVRVLLTGTERETATNAQGYYLLGAPDGTYDMEFTKFGYNRVVVEDVTLSQGDTITVDAQLAAATLGVLIGTITTQTGQPIQGARVAIANTPLDTLITDVNGLFSAELPGTDYPVHTEVRFNTNPPFMIQQDTVLTVVANDTTYATIPLFVQMIEPTDPDTYGYRAYDRYDRDLPAPYEWVELNPESGNPGIPFEYSHHDSALFISTPFPITFYGDSHDTLTVNPNGWMLPGEDHNPGRPNRPIPYDVPVDPAGIIAPFWADLRTGLGNQQFMWYDSAEARWIFEFIDQRLVAPSQWMQNWEVHLLDPAFYPTITGDGEFVFVYGLMEFITTCTVGIESPSEDTGLELLYNGTRETNTWPIAEGSAIRFTTGHSTETGTVSGSLTLYPPSQNITSATIHLSGLQLHPNSSGAFSSSSVPTYYASALMRLPGYEQPRVNRVRVGEDSTTTISMEAWRLDPPRNIAATQSAGIVTLRWNVPQSVAAHANPDVRYTVYRDEELVSGMLADTFFVDEALPFGETVTYTLIAHYRYGQSLPSDPYDVEIMAVDDVTGTLPTEFELHANFPNPFNATTVIAYDIPRLSDVSLKVFDVTGREVATLLDRTMPPGSYRFTWDAQNLPSGMYLTVFEGGTHRFVQKMLLLK